MVKLSFLAAACSCFLAGSVSWPAAEQRRALLTFPPATPPTRSSHHPARTRHLELGPRKGAPCIGVLGRGHLYPRKLYRHPRRRPPPPPRPPQQQQQQTSGRAAPRMWRNLESAQDPGPPRPRHQELRQSGKSSPLDCLLQTGILPAYLTI